MTETSQKPPTMILIKVKVKKKWTQIKERGFFDWGALVLLLYIESISGDPLSKTVLGFKPHIPKEVSNTVPLFCGESSLAQWLWRGDPPTPPLTTTVVTGDGRFTRHYISLHIKRSSVAAAGRRWSRKRTAAPRPSSATAAPPAVTGDAGTAGARKKKKKGTERHQWKHAQRSAAGG